MKIPSHRHCLFDVDSIMGAAGSADSASHALCLISDRCPTGGVEPVAFFFCRVSSQFRGNAAARAAETDLQKVIHQVMGNAPEDASSCFPRFFFRSWRKQRILSKTMKKGTSLEGPLH